MRTPSPTVDLSSLLPRRGIAVRPPASLESGTLGVIALLLLLLAGLLAALGPDVIGDWRMRGEATVAADVQVREKSCRSWLGVFQFCGVTLENGGSPGRTMWYAFIGGVSDASVTPLRSISDPALITTDLGLNHVRSRLISLLFFAAILLGCLGAAAAVLWSGMRAQRTFAALSGQRMVPVVVEIERNNRMPPRRRLWVYLYEVGGRRERALVEWPSRHQPLFTSLDEKWALALQGERGGVPMLLDSELESLDLTETEKAAFRAAFAEVFGSAVKPLHGG
jgi:hypothetical protein